MDLSLFSNINLYSAVHGVTSIIALTTGINLFFLKNKNQVHISWIIYCVFIYLYTFSYFLWSTCTSVGPALLWFKITIMMVAFIHSAFLHFTLAFTNRLDKRHQYLIVFSYAISAILSYLSYVDVLFDYNNVRTIPPFQYWPLAKPAHLIYLTIEGMCLVYCLFILYKEMMVSAGKKRDRLWGFLILTIIGWLGGMTNWFYCFGIPIPPFGNIGITFYVIGNHYLITQYNFLDLNSLFHRSVKYSTFIVFTTLIYMTAIFISERIFSLFFGYSSLFASVITASAIALLFDPFRSKVSKFIDGRIFGKDIITLSHENSMMLKELEEKDKMKAIATFAAGMAHEIKNPLTSLKSFTEAIPEKHHSKEFMDSYARIVPKEIDRMSKLVSQLLDFSRVKKENHLPVQVNVVIEEILTLMRGRLAKKGIEPKANLASDCIALGNFDQLKQVMLNLLNNAVEASHSGQMIKIHSESSSITGKVQIIVEDTGIGIEKENLERIFDPFYSSKNQEGTGLGLTIVKRIVEEHSGTISVQSIIGKGTRFTILLPTHHE